MADIIRFPKHHPLLEPVHWQGRPYVTSYVLHQEYLSNAGMQGKYRQHAHFLRLLRSIEAYQLYIDKGDIVELSWRQVNSPIPMRDQWQPLFEATGYRPLTLINAPAQLALHQHLDDELSQQIAYTTNQAAARKQGQPPAVPLAEETAVRIIKAWQDVGVLFKTPEHLINQEAAKAALQSTGVDFRPALQGSVTQDAIPDEDVMLEPDDLGKRLGLGGGIEANRLLHHWGWQRRTIDNKWEPTERGTPYAARHAWTNRHNGKEGYNYKWNVRAVEQEMLRRRQQEGARS